MQKIQTRLATIDDLEAVAKLFDAYRQFYEQAPDLALATSFIQARIQKEESVILLALDAALYPSFCSVAARPIYALYDLFVIPNARRTGAGKLLLQAAEKIAAEHGKARMDLTTAKTNLPAQAAYESLAWVKDEVFYAYSKSITTGQQS